MKPLTMIAAINDAFKVEMRQDPSVVVFGEDVGVEGGVFRATADLQKEFGEERCFDSPLAESAIAGSAMGMAIAGLRPIIEMQFSGFAWPAFDQVINHISRIRNRSRGTLTAPMVIRMPYGGGIRALEHHSESMEAIWGHIPGLKVVIPSTPYDAKGLLIAAIRDEDPVVFMEPKRVYRAFKQEVPEDAYTLPIGKARVLHTGEQLTLLSYGAQMKEASAAAAILKKEGYSVELIDLRTIFPYDKETILESVRKTGRFLVVHEGPQTFGVASELISAVTTEAFLHLEAPPSRLTGADTIFPLCRGEHHYMISTERIVAEAKNIINYAI
ncbi:MAG TPA: alpha-ketoacid dehydrogenase subunit beta [Candidatus Marinimicrobia bacterium]|nr:alpha-ketoacid dehydrogenase subunit beta [Candidatus Neomarinimicrobiota bacterium]